MTTFACWVGVDSRRVTSINFVADSRISWGQDAKWNAGRKLFSSNESPDIFGYVGDVAFPVTAISTYIDLLKISSEASLYDESCKRHEKFARFIKDSYQNSSGVMPENFTILHASRDGDNMNSRFHLWSLSCCRSNSIGIPSIIWNDREIKISPLESQLLLYEGTGSERFKILSDEFGIRESWKNKPEKRTSRSFFWAFCDALNEASDPASGGAPQLVALHASGPALPHGIVYRGRRYLWGHEVDYDRRHQEILWRDELFQIIDPFDLKPRKGAQRHRRK